MRRVVLKSPVLEYCPPGSVRGARGNPRPYLDKLKSERGLHKATQGHPKATLKPPTSHILWSTEPHQSHPKATPRLPQG